MIIESLLDIDQYFFTMQQMVLHQFSDTQVKYEFKCRNNVDLTFYVEQINAELDNLCRLKFKPEELDYLRTIYYLKKDYVDFLEDFTLKRRYIDASVVNGQLSIVIEGPWLSTIMFETSVLAIVQEVYTKNLPRDVYKEALYKGLENFDTKMRYLTTQIKEKNLKFKFSDFGTRRRFSRDWHTTVVRILARDPLLKDVFTGSSNVLLSKDFINKNPVGTMSHQIFCAAQGLHGVRLSDSQKFMLEAWSKEYRGSLGIALSDTINMDAFLRDFDLFFSKLFDGIRIDSGNNFINGDKVIAHYEKMKIDPMTKTLVFSDGLNFEKMIDIAEYFKDRIDVAFGVGTSLTNDMNLEPLQIVIKMVECNGNPVAKLSDSIGKTMCKDEAFISYLKKVFKI